MCWSIFKSTKNKVMQIGTCSLITRSVLLTESTRRNGILGTHI